MMDWTTLTEFRLLSEPGNEHEAMRRVADAVEGLGLPTRRIDRLKTAVAEATMNATEHGNHFQANLPVEVVVLASENAVSVRITDSGGGPPAPSTEVPDLDAKLQGLQSPRGWGLFLISKMVDEVNVRGDAVHHTIELILNRRGGDNEPSSA